MTAKETPMPRPDLDRLSETLLRGGLAPKHVRRYIAELRDHADDLIRSGVSETDAWVQLGSEDHLAQEMLKRDELKSLGARYPVAYFGFGPVLTMLAALLAGLLVLAAVILSVQQIYGVSSSAELTPEALEGLSSLTQPLAMFMWTVKYAVPVVLAWIFALQALHQRIEPRWVIVGLGLIAIVGGASDISITWPTLEGQKGELQFGFGWFPPFPDLSNSFFRALINFGLVAPALVWLHYLRTQPQR